MPRDAFLLATGSFAAKLDPANKGRFRCVFDEEGVEALKKSMAYGFDLRLHRGRDHRQGQVTAACR